jgi:hypothetical protein
LTNLLAAQLQIIVAGLIAEPTNARAANFLPADVLAILLIKTTWVTMAFPDRLMMLMSTMARLVPTSSKPMKAK